LKYTDGTIYEPIEQLFNHQIKEQLTNQRYEK